MVSRKEGPAPGQKTSRFRMPPSLHLMLTLSTMEQELQSTASDLAEALQMVRDALNAEVWSRAWPLGVSRSIARKNAAKHPGDLLWRSRFETFFFFGSLRWRVCCVLPRGDGWMGGGRRRRTTWTCRRWRR